MGGLGNQLFQLCAGLYLEKKFKSELFYDVSNLSVKTKNENGNFTRNLEILELLPVERMYRLPIRYHNFLTKLRRVSNSKKFFFEIKDNNNDVELVSKKAIYVYGFFQSAKLAEKMWPDLRMSMENSKTFKLVFSAPKIDRITVHMRFGDYKYDSATKMKYGLTEINYYVEAVRVLKEKSQDLKNLLIVTDNAFEARNFIGDLFIDFNVEIHSESDPISDFFDIATSSNVVISNSTFSWWAAFIGSKINNINVVYPRPWMADEMDPEISLYVKDWLAIKRNFQV